MLTGIPSTVATKTAPAAPVSAANPWTGCSLVMRDPIVWMIRHPPDSVPRPIAAWAASTIQNGMNIFPSASTTAAR